MNFNNYFLRFEIVTRAIRTTVKELGEYIPGHTNTLSLNKIKEFVTIPYHIEWYKTPGSRKIFPLFLQELSDLNPTLKTLPGLITRNPYFDHTQIKYFIAYRDRKPVGRIAAFIDYTYTENGGGKIGWFGLFESEQDTGTARMLIDSAVEYLKANSCTKIIGPAKFNAGGEIGLLVDGFENEPYFMEPYNAPYYQDFFKEYGFKKENDWYSIIADIIISKNYMEKVDRILERIINHHKGEAFKDYKIRNVDFSNLESEIETIRELYNPIWNEGNHPQQVRMTDAEFDVLAMGFKEISLEELIFIVEKDGKPVGLSVNIPDVNEVIAEMDGHAAYKPSTRFYSPKDIIRDLRIVINIKKRLRQKRFSRMRFFILGVEEKHRKKGIDLKLYWNIKEKAQELGISRGSASQLADINMDIINPVFKAGKIAMTWRVYGLKV